MARHVRKGDLVMVITGKSRHQRSNVGKVLRVIPGKTRDLDRVVVEGMNLCRKHVRPSQQNQQGGIVEKEQSIHSSNVMPVVDGKPTRVRFENRPDGSKVRIAVRGGGQIGVELRKATR